MKNITAITTVLSILALNCLHAGEPQTNVRTTNPEELAVNVAIEDVSTIVHTEVGVRENTNPEKESIKEVLKDEGKEETISSAVYYTSSHPGTYHRPLAVSAYGETVELEDGSIWNVSYSDRYKTLSWLTSDVIVILPNTSWFATTDYRLVNQNTNDYVDVGLRYGPVLGGLYTYQISTIDYVNGIVNLQDSSWAISFSDESVIYKWLPGDSVIMGINDGWNSSIRPNILINVNVNDYACANCMSY